MMTVGRPADPRDLDDLGPVELQLPPAAEFLRLARFAAADASARAGLGLDDTDDVRLAVSELCSLLTGSGVPITLRFESAAGVVVVHGRGAPGPAYASEAGVLARTVVEAVVDECRVDHHDGRTEFRFTKLGGTSPEDPG